MDLFQAVKKFHEAFDLPISREPIFPSGEVSRRRYNLIREEVREAGLAGFDPVGSFWGGAANILLERQVFPR